MRKLTQLMLFWLGIIMVGLVLFLGFALLFTDFYDERLYGTKRTVFIFVLFGYAVYRSYRTYTLYKNKHEVD